MQTSCNVINKKQNEEWKDIPDFEGLYAVSNYGRVMRTGITHNGTKLRVLKGSTSAGYPSITMYKNGKYTHKYIHDLVMIMFHGPRPHGFTVNHKDGDKSNNQVENLEYVSYSENNKHAYATGLKPRGENLKKSKLNDDMVREMRVLRPSMSLSQLANKYGVHVGTINQVFTGRTWTHVI